MVALPGPPLLMSGWLFGFVGYSLDITSNFPSSCFSFLLLGLLTDALLPFSFLKEKPKLQAVAQTVLTAAVSSWAAG